MGDTLSPAGSSTYSSNTMYVGDGTWDSSRNDFLLPNLMGLNFETMRYNGMGNRFANMPGYHSLIKGHGVIAAITFLFIVPTAILTARFYGRSPAWALKWHIYLQILTVGLSTVVFTLGWFAVGPDRSLTNPHHGIGLAIYVLILVQAIGGSLIHRIEKGRVRRRIPIKLVLHQWLGRMTALLGIAQVPLGLTLYGSPKYTFILYALWMSFLLVLYFVLSYRAMAPIGGHMRESSHGGTVIEDRKPSRFGLLGPLAAGAGAAALLSGRRRSQSRNRSRSRSRREEVIPSRRGSGSFIEEDEKYESRRRKSGGGVMDGVFKGAAALGAAALATTWWEKRQRKKEDDEYSAVATDTPSRRHNRRSSRHNESEISEESRMEEGRRPRTPLLPGPGDPVVAAAAISAAEGPVTPRPAPAHSHGRSRRSSYDSYSYYDSTLSPSRRPRSEHGGVGKGILAGLGLGWFAKKMKDRKDKKEMARLDQIEQERLDAEREKRRGASGRGSRFTGDGHPSPVRKQRRRGPDSITESSILSSVIDDPHQIRPGSSIPPIPAALAGAGSTAAIGRPAGSRQDIIEPVAMPEAPPDPHGLLHPEESGSETYMSNGGHPHRRPSERRRRAGEAAAAEAVAAAAGLAAAEEEARRRSRSRGGSGGPNASGAVDSPPVSVKVKVHGDKDRNVTLRRLTEQEAAAEREARRTQREQRRRADSISSLSGTDTAASRRRYRRDEREAERRAESSVGAAPPPPMTPLSPPNPAFAAGRRPKDSAYYSGRPGESSGLGGGPGATTGSLGSPESHGTWSGMSPASGVGSEDPAERRRRRRLERNRQSGGGGPPTTVEFT
ncbi:hypothetical protein G7Y89_g13788 [Cudoniella acicularis]|uniref:Cytochrome b561 domain-containing protein n=1 Tax=Cudoniella acicularis TaxID=354080 RepID=A0A8H4R950_9HELO|nr:hypothetical protein G7Y89_g13788 [Cudoniella acicularis]